MAIDQLLKTQQSLTGILATKTREVARKQIMINSLQQELEDTEVQYANSTAPNYDGYHSNRVSPSKLQTTILNLKAENQEKMNLMIQNMTNQFEREKESFISDYNNQIETLRQTLKSEREQYNVLYTQYQNLEVVKDTEYKDKINVEMTKQKNELDVKLDAMKEELVKKEQELQDAKSNNNNNDNADKEEEAKVEEVLATLRKELNDKHSNEMEIVRKESTRLNNIVQEKNDQVAELNGKVTKLNSKLTISESTITNLKYEIEQIKNKKSETNENDTIQKLTLLKEEHLKAIQDLKKNHQNELEDVRQQMREESSAALTNLQSLTKLEQNMEIEALKAKHQSDILKIRGEKTKQAREEALNKIKSTFHTSAEEYHPRNDNKEQADDVQ